MTNEAAEKAARARRVIRWCVILWKEADALEAEGRKRKAGMVTRERVLEMPWVAMLVPKFSYPDDLCCELDSHVIVGFA